MAFPDFKQTTVNAVVGKMNADEDRIKLYTAEMPAELVAHFYVEAAVSTSGGFQRALDSNRAARIGRLMGGDSLRHVPPTPNVHGGLLAYADEDEIDFKGGRLTVKAPLRLIDGQHRAGGAKFAVEYGTAHNYTETVRVIVGATKAELAMWYLRCNLEARKVAPANIILNVATMNGIVLRRKSWIARMVVALAAQEPLVVHDEKLVSFTANDGGRIQAQTLYRMIDLLLPSGMNREGPEIEAAAVQHAWQAIDMYASIVPDWGDTDDKDNFKASLAYSFTLMVAYARLYAAVWEEDKDEEEIRDKVSEAFSSVLESAESPTFGSGEKAAVALASYAAGQVGIALDKLAA